ncbi:hypothetical protein KBC89_00515 [Candidatus Woesebacteria bacterium]|nr:hypothetical protein [Candidatus Woesebacteria bacterium]
MKTLRAFFLVLVPSYFLVGCTIQLNDLKTSEIQEPTQVSATSTPEPTVSTEMYLGQQTNPDEAYEKLCAWVDKSDIIIELSFADGVVKDTSYEAGFSFSSIERTARLAREGCNYQTGFKFSELANKGEVQVAVWGYTDNRKRQLLNEPINLTFDSEGKPSIPLPIRITVLD